MQFTLRWTAQSVDTSGGDITRLLHSTRNEHAVKQVAELSFPPDRYYSILEAGCRHPRKQLPDRRRRNRELPGPEGLGHHEGPVDGFAPYTGSGTYASTKYTPNERNIHIHQSQLVGKVIRNI